MSYDDKVRTLGANPYLPTGYMVSTWWVLKQNTQHGTTGSILITFTICPQFAHPNTHQVHVEYFQKVPSTEPIEGGVDLPAGFILINFTFCPQFAHPNTHWAHVEYFYKVPTQIPANRQIGYSCEFIKGLFKKYPPCDQNVPSGYLVSSLRVCGEIELHCEFFVSSLINTHQVHCDHMVGTF